MKLRVPHYYDKFVCIASDCKDNCCYGGWQIDIDEETVEYYKKVEGPFGEKLKAAIDYTDTHCFKLKNGMCPFLDSNNLCQIYKELGPEHMGVVCTQFPRFTEYYGEIKESGIGLACEEAARIIFTDLEKFHYIEKEIQETLYVDEEYDTELGDGLFNLRNQLIELIQDETVEFSSKLCILVKAANDVQQMININDYAAVKAYKVGREIPVVGDDFSEGLVKEIWYAFLEMESLNDEWGDLADKLLDKLHSDEDNNEEKYIELIRKFAEEKYLACGYNRLVEYYLHRYFMKAVYDHNVMGKAQFIVACLVVLNDMDMFFYLRKNHFSMEDRLRNIHIFSREVEYSEDNLDILNEEFLFGNVFSVEGLISVIKNIF